MARGAAGLDGRHGRSPKAVRRSVVNFLCARFSVDSQRLKGVSGAGLSLSLSIFLSLSLSLFLAVSITLSWIASLSPDSLLASGETLYPG